VRRGVPAIVEARNVYRVTSLYSSTGVPRCTVVQGYLAHNLVTVLRRGVPVIVQGLLEFKDTHRPGTLR